MGEKKARKKRLLAENPACCFCGGSNASEEEDHVPPRSCFVGREWPEGYSFAACKRCNAESRQSELISAFYVRWMDHEDSNLVDADLQRLMDGMKNNHPTLLPRTNLNEGEIAKALSQINYAPMSLGPLPIVGLPNGVKPHLAWFSRKLTCALFYKETARIVSSTASLWTHWLQYHDKRLPQFLETLGEALPAFREGVRSSRSLNSQFKYMFGAAPSGMLFAFVAQFGKSMVVVGAVHDGSLTDERIEHWRTLDEILEAERQLLRESA